MSPAARRWPSLLSVAAGGLVGSAARTGIGLLIPTSQGRFPTEVVVVNLVGSFLLGLYLSRRERAVSGPSSMRFWAIGLLGSFTTFSTFSVDLVLLFEAGRLASAVVYLVVSLLGGLALGLTGQRMGRAPA